ncbi:hypothetical protein KM043_000330 [Ampulex compressa]|nr:hypothetical protein KM043_000330 [Ampulex compressa]
MSEIAKICAICAANAAQKCSGCENVFYCSREHQKLHWKVHSKNCKCFKISTDSRVGRHYVASRNVKPDEIILKDEQPLVAGPMYNTVPLCLGCYAVLSSDIAVPCEKCGWPLCKACKTHGPECEFTCRYRGTKVSITEYGYPHPTYRCISVIRGLCLRETNPASYQKLLALESHCDLAQKNMSFAFEEPTDVARFIERFFKVQDIPLEEIIKIAGVLQVNGHEVPITNPPHMAVYDLASFFEHECRANCSKSFTNNGGMIIYAALPILKGEHISICYTDALWGVTNRRHHLARTKFFECTCKRCADPTEFGTMFNAIKCKNGDCSGNMLPPSFLQNSETLPDYKCDRCGFLVSWWNVEQMLENIGVELTQMKKENVDACLKFINRYKEVLHENHFYNVDVKIALAQMLCQQSGDVRTVGDDLLSEKIILCKKLDKLLEILVPAENRIRGWILFELHAALAEFSRRQGMPQLIAVFNDSVKCLTNAYRLLHREPEILPEGMIALRAQKNLQEVESIMKRSI